MLDFLGRFHPVFVHLPIGILLLGCVFILLSFKQQFTGLKAAIPITLFLGALGAIVSCITGYFLANAGEYDIELVSAHQWMGIGTAFFSLLLYFIYEKVASKIALVTISILLILMISITGHLGGSLTHGSDYLTAPIANDSSKGTSAIPRIRNVQEAFIYEDAIKPMLKNRCYSCHSAEKQKGKLRLDDETWILKGGKNGPAIVAGNIENSELIRRILLPLTDEEHMAPKEKPQLTLNEIKLLEWWIANGADFKKKFKEIPQPAAIKPVLEGLQNGENFNSVVEEVPAKPVDALDEAQLKSLTDAGVTVFPIMQNSNYISANFINANISQSVLTAIPVIEKQLLWLNLSNKSTNDQTLKAFENCKNLTKLNLNYTQITDGGLMHLKKLAQLQSLSLVGTKITLKSLEQLQQLKKLKFLYLYQSGLKQGDMSKVKQFFPQAIVDTGNYKVPVLPQDTIEVKAPDQTKK